MNRLLDETARKFALGRGNVPLQIHDGHVGKGYGLATDDDLRFYAELARTEGILLDPCYTGKAFRGLLREIERTPRTIRETHPVPPLGRVPRDLRVRRSLPARARVVSDGPEAQRPGISGGAEALGREPLSSGPETSGTRWGTDPSIST